MKLTNENILAIEDLINRREKGIPAREVITQMKDKSQHHRESTAYAFFSVLKVIGVAVDNGRCRNGFANISAQELAEFRAWKQFRDQALGRGVSQ